MSGGGQEPVGAGRGVSIPINTPVTSIGTNSEIALLGVRLKAGRRGADVDLERVSSIVTTGTNYRLRILHNPTISVAVDALSWTAVGNSSLEYFIGTANNTVTGGVEIFSQYVSKELSSKISDLRNSLKLGIALDGTADVQVMTIQPNTNNETALGSLNWREIP